MASIARRWHQRLSKAQRRQRRRRQTRQTRAVRRRQLHDQLPCPARALLDTLGRAFTTTPALRFALLLAAALLTVGRHTVANLLRTLGPLVPGDGSCYRRVFSRRRWSSWRLARLLLDWVVPHLLPDGPIVLAGDDTVDEHRGKKVYGKARHRDPVRSTHSYTAFRWGHKWVVVAVLVRFPFARRLWVLPILVALDRSEEENRRRGRRPKTPPELLRQLLGVLLRWLPRRQVVGVADGNYATHDLARRAARRPTRLTYVSHFDADANLDEPAPRVVGKKPSGRPRKKGRKLPAPAEVVRQAKRHQRLKVAWYGGGHRDVEVVAGKAHWYQAGQPLVPVVWVWVRDCTGTHRDEYFCTTEVTWTARQVIETYTGRWNIETTFEEMRAELGLETTRGWTEKTGLRVAPCLFGLYTVVVALSVQLPARCRREGVIGGTGKEGVTFSDSITAVRRWLWVEWAFVIPGHNQALAKLSRPCRQRLLAGLAPAA